MCKKTDSIECGLCEQDVIDEDKGGICMNCFNASGEALREQLREVNRSVAELETQMAGRFALLVEYRQLARRHAFCESCFGRRHIHVGNALVRCSDCEGTGLREDARELLRRTPEESTDRFRDMLDVLGKLAARQILSFDEENPVGPTRRCEQCQSQAKGIPIPHLRGCEVGRAERLLHPEQEL